MRAWQKITLADGGADLLKQAYLFGSLVQQCRAFFS